MKKHQLMASDCTTSDCHLAYSRPVYKPDQHQPCLTGAKEHENHRMRRTHQVNDYDLEGGQGKKSKRLHEKVLFL